MSIFSHSDKVSCFTYNNEKFKQQERKNIQIIKIPNFINKDFINEFENETNKIVVEWDYKHLVFKDDFNKLFLMPLQYIVFSEYNGMPRIDVLNEQSIKEKFGETIQKIENPNATKFRDKLPESNKLIDVEISLGGEHKMYVTGFFKDGIIVCEGVSPTRFTVTLDDFWIYAKN